MTTKATVKDYSADVETIKEIFRNVRADLGAALESGNEAQVLAIKEMIVSVKDLSGVLVSKTFDTTIDFMHTHKGEDFMPKVTRIYQPRGRTAGEKKEVDPFA
jgi:hypothetical protein